MPRVYIGPTPAARAASRYRAHMIAAKRTNRVRLAALNSTVYPCRSTVTVAVWTLVETRGAKFMIACRRRSELGISARVRRASVGALCWTRDTSSHRRRELIYCLPKQCTDAESDPFYELSSICIERTFILHLRTESLFCFFLYVSNHSQVPCATLSCRYGAASCHFLFMASCLPGIGLYSGPRVHRCFRSY